MSWEQHRYAVERAARMRSDAADAINDHCMECGMKVDPDISACRCIGGPVFAGVTLQGEANSSDAEMLGEVADFLKSLEGSKADDILENPGQAFVDDWNQAITTLSNFCGFYNLPKPDMIFHQKWRMHMSRVAQREIGSPLIYAGVRVRFGTLESMDVLRP